MFDHFYMKHSDDIVKQPQMCVFTWLLSDQSRAMFTYGEQNSHNNFTHLFTQLTIAAMWKYTFGLFEIVVSTYFYHWRPVIYIDWVSIRIFMPVISTQKPNEHEQTSESRAQNSVSSHCMKILIDWLFFSFQVCDLRPVSISANMLTNITAQHQLWRDTRARVNGATNGFLSKHSRSLLLRIRAQYTPSPPWTSVCVGQSAILLR